MYKDGKIWLANTDDGREISMLPAKANRHGLVAGATGTGKTVTLKVMAETFSEMGVPVFMADVKGDLAGIERRIDFQRSAMTDMKVLGYFAMLAMEQNCILPKQYEQVARFVTDCQNLLGAWMNSDRKRLQP